MRRNLRVTAVIGVLATAVVATASRPIAAQPRLPIVADCNGDSLAKRTEAELGGLYELTPNQVWQRLLLQRTGRDFAEMGDTARAVFAALAPPGMDPTARQNMTRLLDTLQQELIRTDTDPTFRAREGPAARLMQIAEGDIGEPWSIGSAPNVVQIAEGTPDSTRRAVCWTALLAGRIAVHGGQNARREALRVLAARERRWSNFERSGYSLTPLELFVNGLCGACRPELEPPRTQIILAHMLPSYLVREGGGNRAALTTELAGVLFYSSSRSFHWGGSLALAFPTEEKGEIGFMLHVSTLGQLGVTAPLSSFSAKNASLLLSADLYRYIERWNGSLRDEREAVKRGIAREAGVVQ